MVLFLCVKMRGLRQAAGARVGKMCGLGLNTLEYTGADIKYAGLVR